MPTTAGPVARAPSSAFSRTSEIRRGLFPNDVFDSFAGPSVGKDLDLGHPFFGVKDLELLYFYTSTTCFTVFNIPERQLLWQQVIPRIAFTHHFLLHGIMAFSALHLTYLQSERKETLYVKASAHHDIDLRLFQTAMLDINSQNCNNCFAYSSILVVFTWASSEQSGDLFFSGKTKTGEIPEVVGRVSRDIQ